MRIDARLPAILRFKPPLQVSSNPSSACSFEGGAHGYDVHLTDTETGKFGVEDF